MKTMTIRRLSFGSLFKILVTGFSAIFIPIFMVMGILAYLGVGDMNFTFNGETVHGVMILVHSAWLSVFMPFWFALFFGGIVFLGNLIYSRFRTVDIRYTQD